MFQLKNTPDDRQFLVDMREGELFSAAARAVHGGESAEFAILSVTRDDVALLKSSLLTVAQISRELGHMEQNEWAHKLVEILDGIEYEEC